MSTHNIGLMENLPKVSFTYHQIPSLLPFIKMVQADLCLRPFIKMINQIFGAAENTDEDKQINSSMQLGDLFV